MNADQNDKKKNLRLSALICVLSIIPADDANVGGQYYIAGQLLFAGLITLGTVA